VVALNSRFVAVAVASRCVNVNWAKLVVSPVMATSGEPSQDKALLKSVPAFRAQNVTV